MKIEKHLFIKYFLGQASDEEKEAIHQWITISDSNRQELIRERICFDASILVDEKQMTKKRTVFISPLVQFSLKIAASILFLLGSLWLYDNYQMNKLSHIYQCISVPAGNRTNITLPDGTNVWLNAGTTLRYPSVFSRDNREIILDGEAFFEVVKDKKPFVVKTNKYNIEVLGTTFNVEAYSHKSEFETTLYTGKVKLYNSKSSHSVILLPGQTACLSQGRLKVFNTTDNNKYRWKDGLIYIESKSFNEIMNLFEKFYEIQIVINNKHVRDLGYRGKLRTSDGIEHALRVLQIDYPFVYKRDEEKNIIYIN